jgi:hypothetical protein
VISHLGPGNLSDCFGDVRLSGTVAVHVGRGGICGRASSAATFLGSTPASAARSAVRVGGDHRCGSVMDGGDDLGVVDPAQVAGGDGEVGMPELSLDHEQRDPLARHLHRVRVSKLVRREPASHPGYGGGVV